MEFLFIPLFLLGILLGLRLERAYWRKHFPEYTRWRLRNE